MRTWSFSPRRLGRDGRGWFRVIREGKFKGAVVEQSYSGLRDVRRRLQTLEEKKSWGKVVIDVESAGGSSKL